MCTGTLWTIVSLSRLNAIIELAPYGYRAKLNAVFHLARMRPQACCYSKQTKPKEVDCSLKYLFVGIKISGEQFLRLRKSIYLCGDLWFTMPPARVV